MSDNQPTYPTNEQLIKIAKGFLALFQTTDPAKKYYILASPRVHYFTHRKQLPTQLSNLPKSVA